MNFKSAVLHTHTHTYTHYEHKKHIMGKSSHDDMSMQLLKLKLSLSLSLSHTHTSATVCHYLQQRNVPLIIGKLNTELYFAFLHLKWKPSDLSLLNQMKLSYECVCVCVYVCAYVSVCLRLTWGCEMLSHSHPQRARWGTMETLPRVIFILNTTYSLPGSPLFVSLHFFPSLDRSFSLSLLYFLHFFTPTHWLTGSGRFPCLFSNGK